MTDRFVGFVIVLDEPTRSDDAKPLLATLKQLKWVKSVQAIHSTMEIDFAYLKAKSELFDKMLKGLEEFMRE